MGDSVNWEWIIYCAKVTKNNIAIVSRDDDYGVVNGEDTILNDQLKTEFSRRVNQHQTISLFRGLTDVLKRFDIKVTAKEKVEDNRLIENARARSPMENLLPGYEGVLMYVEYLNALANGPLAMAAQTIAHQKAAEAGINHLADLANSPAIQLAQSVAQIQADLEKRMGGKKEDPT